MARERLKTIIINAIPIAIVTAYVGSSFWMINNQDRINSFLEDKIKKVETIYKKYEPTLRTIESAYSSAAMLSFGMWDPNYESFKPDKNSDE